MKDKKDNEIHLVVVVNGKGVHLQVEPSAELGSLVEPALEKAKVADKSEPQRWIFTNAAGEVLDKARTISSFSFKHNEEISLSLEAGVVG